MKNYLNSKDMNDLLFVTHLLDIISTMVDEWLKHGNLTKDEAKYMRMAVTWTSKFIKTVLGRMPEKEVTKFLKRTKNAEAQPIRIIDSWMRDRVLGVYDTEYEIVKIERPQLEKLAFLSITNYCKDCDKSYYACELYDILEDNLVPRCETKNNCPYAYISKEVQQKIEEKRQARIESKGKISKRKAKKIANRYDD